MNDALRQTGRTTRLIEKAVQLADQGRAVYVFISTEENTARYEQRIDDIWVKHWPGRAGHGIKVERGVPPNFDWVSGRLRGAHPNNLCLLDHFLVEQRIERLQKHIADLAAEVGNLYPLTT